MLPPFSARSNASSVSSILVSVSSSLLLITAKRFFFSLLLLLCVEKIWLACVFRALSLQKSVCTTKRRRSLFFGKKKSSLSLSLSLSLEEECCSSTSTKYPPLHHQTRISFSRSLLFAVVARGRHRSFFFAALCVCTFVARKRRRVSLLRVRKEGTKSHSFSSFPKNALRRFLFEAQKKWCSSS